MSARAAVTPAQRTRSPLFITPNTNFAAYATATNQLRFCGAREATEGRNGVEFLFDDPDGVGLRLLHSFKSGNAKPTEPRALFEAQSFMKSEVKRILRAAETADVRPVPVR